ncbi:hypothetical protein PROFUN_02990 [Planoprotostelium fungivorum]|uniref:Uncharacterized protein n=1 Tax=Planoprotostelium fungivorum TaxID=1890364 RepID=A0A2P6NXA7_9EUKA|nr:hypothetical protein PROFUN_02990 [Planoprotostelium fungivorum]
MTEASEDEKDAKRMELLTAFLDQPRPAVTTKMREFLGDAGVKALLLQFLTRPHQALSPVSFPQRRPGSGMSINNVDDTNIIRSYKLMDLFLNPANDMVEIFAPHMEQSLVALFEIFESDSAGNFHHFQKVLGRFLSRAPAATSSTLLTHGLLWKLFENCHEPAVADAVMDSVCLSFSKHTDALNHFKGLVEVNIHERVGEYLFQPNPISPHVCEVWIRVLEKLSSQELSGVLFLSLCKTSTFIDGLFSVVTSKDKSFSIQQKQAVASVLRDLLLRSPEKAIVRHAFARPIPNMLLAIHGKLHEHAKVRVESMCNVLVSRDSSVWGAPPLQLSTHTVKKPLGMYNYTILEILTEIITINPDTVAHITQPGWRVLGSWFLEYTHNNLLHGLFYRVFRVMLSPQYADSQRLLLQRNKFLSKLIDHFKNPDPCVTASRGILIIMLNALRLAGDSTQDGFIKNYLSSQEAWKSFLPILCDVTIKQVTPFSDVDEENRDTGIQLGSAFARSLGFDGESPAPVVEMDLTSKKKKKKKPKKKKKEEGTSDSDGQSDVSSVTSEDDDSSVEDATPATEDATPSEEVPPTKMETSEDEPKPSPATLNWWANLTSNLEEEDEKESQSGSDWWNDLKDSLETEA